MNQILSVEMSNNQNRKSNKKASIKAVVTFFCIILLIFAIAIIAIGILSMSSNEEEENNSSYIESENKPNIEIIQGTTSLNITISSTEQIANVVYRWNNEEETQVNGNGETTMELTINIPLGTNILNIVATDVNGVQQTFEKEYTGVDIYEPSITLEQEDNNLIIAVTSEETIDYISYYYDDEDEATQYIDDVSAQISVEVQEGEHTLTIVVTNIDGESYEDTRSIYIPTVTVVTDGTDFIVRASDSRGITTISINFNGEEQEETVNDTEYETRLTLQDGENRVILVVTNSDGLSITKRVRYEK